MNDKGMFNLQTTTEQVVREMIERYHMKVEEFTEEQVAQIISQMLMSGDFVHNIANLPDGKTGHSITYLPFRAKYTIESEMEGFKESFAQYVQATKALVADYKQGCECGDWGDIDFEKLSSVITYREAEKNLDSILTP